jgi:hypothetical protein
LLTVLFTLFIRESISYNLYDIDFILQLRRMDDFEKNFPEFDWKNTPAYKHPLGRDCPCPKHEYIREQISIAKNLSESKSNNKHRAQITLKFCPDHYNVYFKEVIPSMPLKHRLMTKFALKLGAIIIQKIPYMQSDQCFYCKFGSGGFDKRQELPPI